MGEVCEESTGLRLQEANKFQCVDVRLVFALLSVREETFITLRGEFIDTRLRERICPQCSNLLRDRWRPTPCYRFQHLVQDRTCCEVFHTAIIHGILGNEQCASYEMSRESRPIRTSGT